MAPTFRSAPVYKWILLGVAGCVPATGAEESAQFGAKGSGQTGSPSCSETLSCPCASLNGRVLVTGTVEEASAGRTKVRVASVIVPGELVSLHSAASLRAGERLIGYDDRPEECTGAPGSAASVGSEVFAAYSLGALVLEDFIGCTSRPACEGSVCEDDDASTDVCPGRMLALETGNIWTAPLADSVTVSEGVALPMADIAALTHADVCKQQFPGPSDPSCEDTRIVAEPEDAGAGGCALAGAARGSLATAWCAAAALLWLAFSRQRRPR